MMLTLRSFGLFGATALFVAAGCSAGSSSDDTASGGSSSSSQSGGSTSQFMGTGGSMSGCFECSADLHNVLDCNGGIIQTCGADQGCSPNGTCVSACQAAAENKSTIGCDFYSVTPAIISESRGSCFAAMIANTWTSPISISAEFAGQTIDVSPYTYIPQGQGTSLTYQPLSGGMLGPGQLGIVFLSNYQSGDIYHVDCPVQQALSINTQVDDGTNTYEGVSGFGNAFHITTTAPIVAYDVYPWGGAPSFATSSTLLIPTPAWTTNYITADGWGAAAGYPFTQVVGSEDGTTVTMVPVTDVVGGNGLPGGAANAALSFTLNRGQVAQFLQSSRLAGSVLSSDKPIGVWGGGSCMNIPDGYVACDAGHQELLPVQTLGNDYVVARYPSRGGDDNAPITFVGMVDGTTLAMDPPLPGAPPTLNRGQLVIMSTDQPFHVNSQDADHPFYVAAHMTGGQLANGIGDPEFVSIVPPAQYLTSYLFATDPTYRYTSLVFFRQKDPSGAFQDVNLDCMGPVTGWTPVGSSGQYEVSRLPIVSNGSPTGNCDNGVHTATSNVPFGLTVWGYDSYVSYAYPAGMSVKPINTVVIPPIPQ